MKPNTKLAKSQEVDKGLVMMFLKMSPDERLRTNDNALRAILELRNAYRKQKTSRCIKPQNGGWDEFMS